MFGNKLGRHPDTASIQLTRSLNRPHLAMAEGATSSTLAHDAIATPNVVYQVTASSFKQAAGQTPSRKML